MTNLDKEITVSLIDAMSKVVQNEIKVMVKTQFAGGMFIPRFVQLSRGVCCIFGLTEYIDITDVENEMIIYFDELKEKSRRHIKDSMNDNWDWIS
jgi:hypothetical protein